MAPDCRRASLPHMRMLDRRKRSRDNSLFSATSLLSLCVCTANFWNHLLLARVSTRTWFSKWSITRLKNAMALLLCSTNYTTLIKRVHPL